ncbi:MAG: hypothetical protein JSW27_08580 [Phycisphaerales bacterium]|nr:MAG: hypothetical protein JSW27_08580 [Phycisphaerales bacterium]
MILLDPRAPFVFGVVMIGLLGVYLVIFHAMPGSLATPHAEAVQGTELKTCDCCHTEEGLTAGCLTCHKEIGGQIAQDQGDHAFLVRTGYGDCAPCHPDHMGPDFPLVNALSWRGRDPNHFEHPHVTFALSGAHDNLACDACHQGRLSGQLTLSGFPNQLRESTYLGLTQVCVDCHADVHAGGLAKECQSCHDQHQWRPARLFRHDEYYVLEGTHAQAECSGCHLIPERGDPNLSSGAVVDDIKLVFNRVRGTTCFECHEDPHRTTWAKDCVDCHAAADMTWAEGNRGMSPDLHVLSGFALEVPHANVACEACHPAGLTYAQRFPDPNGAHYGRRVDNCAGCHDDPHGGQFEGRYANCLDCHEKEHFSPARFDTVRHIETYPLNEAHAAAECVACHPADPNTGVHRYVATPRSCEACHDDPHGGQFEAGYANCQDCHTEEHFSPARFDGIRHAEVYPLTKPHVAAECVACHPADPNTGIHRYVATPRQCEACHDDPHGGQFDARYADCLDCHDEDRFRPTRFDIERHAKVYSLKGGHKAIPCVQCHVVKKETTVRLFVDTPRLCKTCHENPHGLQFRRELTDSDCMVCHSGEGETFRIRPYDHHQRTGYELTGTHAKADCTACHLERRLRDPNDASTPTRLYRGTPTACVACHADIHRGQFEKEDRVHCDRCHGSTIAWTADRFDHNRDSRFVLEKAHLDVACQACHPSVRQPDGEQVTQYRPLGTRCEDCHGFVPK